MRLYQYVKADVIEKAFTSDGFWVKASHPCEFNDPFECTGGVYGDPKQSFVDELFANTTSMKSLEYLHCESKKNIRRVLWQAFMDRRFLGQAYKISCFSDAERLANFPGSDIRMWAHYANNGMGVRIEFDSEDIPYRFDAVKYTYESPKLNLSEISSVDDIDAYIETCVVTKHKIWEPEQEVRIIFRGSSEGVCFDPEVRLWRWLLPIGYIKEIAIGEALLKSSNSSSSMKRIQSIVRNAPQTIFIVASVRDYNSFGLKYREITI